jgi:2-polyprenyl-3-methyl-5-hydroxy-6-metoxy-1,4-benzoquinol methylase
VIGLAKTRADARRPLILIGIPCYGPVSPLILEEYMRFAFHLGRRLPQYDFKMGIRSKSEQFRARHHIAEGAIACGADYTLMIDDDMVFNVLGTQGATDAYGFVEKLIAHDKDICGVLYYQKEGMCAPVLMNQSTERGYRFLRDEEVEHRLQKVDVAGGGCLLIKTKVFEHLSYPYFGPEYEWGTDVQLCRKAAEKGYETWADTSIELGHQRVEQTVVTTRNRHQFQVEDQIPGEYKTQFITSAVYTDVIADACEWTGYHDLEEMSAYAQTFHGHWPTHKGAGGTDPEWYRLFPKERVCRQIWYNLSSDKRKMTEFLLNSVDHTSPKEILDFGCGIGIPSFYFAMKGHHVLAVDIAKTGTLEFLKWRAKKHHVPLSFYESRGGVPAFGDRTFDIVVAMDVLEHLPDGEWQIALGEIARRIKPGGVLFANNAVLDDPHHAEHYWADRAGFIRECVKVGLMPFNQIVYTKADLTQSQPSTMEDDLAHA